MLSFAAAVLCDGGWEQGGQLLSTACGSPCYAAPEMIAGKKYVGPKVGGGRHGRTDGEEEQYGRGSIAYYMP